MWTLYFAILALIFATGKSTNILTAQKVIILTSLWSVTLVGTITLRSRTFNLIITSSQYYKLNRDNSSKTLKFLDILFFLFIKHFGFLLLKVFSKIEAKNTHLIPKEGAIILISNHSSHVDTFALQATFPRRITYMILSKHCESWGKWFYKSQHTIPIKENGVNCDALKGGLELLDNNGTLGVFPEGKLSPDGNIQEGKNGINFLAMKSKATIVPVYIDGAFDVWSTGTYFPRLFKKIYVVYGNPIHFNTQYTNEKIHGERVSNGIMDEVQKLKNNLQC